MHVNLKIKKKEKKLVSALKKTRDHLMRWEEIKSKETNSLSEQRTQHLREADQKRIRGVKNIREGKVKAQKEI